MKFFQRKSKCPYCGMVLQAKPTQKQECPTCHKNIIVRNGELVTEEQATIKEWLERLAGFGIDQREFNYCRDDLSREFSSQASVNDTVWRILNNLVLIHAGNNKSLELIYGEMSRLVSSEGKDPTKYLIEAEKARNRQQTISTTPQKQVFLGQTELEYIRAIRKEGKLDQAEQLLLKAEPSPAVLDELRKIASTRAKIAKKDGDWKSVVSHLEGYVAYANQWRKYCIKSVNQEPPDHTDSDCKLLQEAKGRLSNK